MKEKLLLLIRLQECDLELVKLSAKKKMLPEQMRKLDSDRRENFIRHEVENN